MMLKKLISVILLLAFAAHMFNSELIVFDYYTNTAAFAKNCVNKARPMMHCNGKCQMMKKLQEQQKKEEQLPERNFGSLEWIDQNNSIQLSSLLFTDIPPIPFSIYHPPFMPCGSTGDLLKPPLAA